MSELLADALIVSLSKTSWDDVWRSRHHVASRLAESNDVLFVSPASARGAHRGGPAVQQRSPRLTTYVPPPWLPSVPHRPVVNRALDRVRQYVVRRLARQYGNEQVVLYLWDPAFLGYVASFPGALVVYHLFDELTMYGDASPLRALQLDAALKRADLVIVASPALAEKYGRDREVKLCPNGVDYEVFARAGAPPAGTLDDLPRPRLVYSGTLRRQIDIGLLDRIAAARPDWTLMLVGDVAANVAAEPEYLSLVRHANVRSFGRRSQRDVAAVLAGADVGLMPYRQDGAAPFCSPLKLPEYLAVGLPVVSSPLGGAVGFDESVVFADGLPEWLAAIDGALASDTAERRQARRSGAAAHSWDARVRDIRRWLAEALAQRRSTG